MVDKDRNMCYSKFIKFSYKYGSEEAQGIKIMEHKINRYMYYVEDIHSIEDFARVKNNSGTDHRQVCFARALGAGRDDILRLDSLMLQNMRAGSVLYNRIRAFPTAPAAQDAEYYSGCYRNWTDSQKSCMQTRASGNDAELSGLLGKAVSEITDKYRQIKPGMSETIERNFVVKLLYWFDVVIQELTARRVCAQGDGEENIKLAVHNVAKEQEFLFCYMLTLVGVDVLLLQSKSDIVLSQPLNGLSTEFALGSFADVDVPDFSPEESQTAPQSAAAQENLRHGAATGTDSTENNGNIRVVIPQRHDRRKTQPQPAAMPRQPERTPEQPVRVSVPRRVAPASPVTRSDARVEMSFEQLAQLASSVVMINIHDKKGEFMGSGSGIMIGRKGYILTNQHVASGGSYYTVRIEDDETCYKTKEIIKYNHVLDLAVIRIDRALNPLPVYRGAQGLVRGQKVVAIGSPLGLFNSVSDGIISGFRKFDGVDMIQFTAPTSPGSSGGAVLNMYGEVIGISTAGIPDAQGINLAVGYEFINMFIQGFTG